MKIREERLWAVGGTVIATVLLVLLLMFCKLGTSYREMLAAASIPEPEDEELFIDPEDFELTPQAGEEMAMQEDEPAPQDLGEPEMAETPVKEQVEPGDNSQPAPKQPKQVTQQQESAVKKQDPPKTDKDQQRLQERTAGKFDRNGYTTGRNESTGSGGEGVGLSGTASGRSFLGCPKPDVYVRNKTTVRVTVTVTPEGTVSSAKATGGNAELRSKCEKAAMSARWSKKRGTTTTGEITFIITPK